MICLDLTLLAIGEQKIITKLFGTWRIITKLFGERRIIDELTFDEIDLSFYSLNLSILEQIVAYLI
jgi:hypothetical protein